MKRAIKATATAVVAHVFEDEAVPTAVVVLVRHKGQSRYVVLQFETRVSASAPQPAGRRQPT